MTDKEWTREQTRLLRELKRATDATQAPKLSLQEKLNLTQSRDALRQTLHMHRLHRFDLVTE